jgi:hypothetical protein
MNEQLTAQQSPKILLALLALAWATAIGALAVWFIFRAPFESPRFVLGGAGPGAAIAAAGTALAAGALVLAVRTRKAIPWACIVLALNAGYLLLFVVSL